MRKDILQMWFFDTIALAIPYVLSKGLEMKYNYKENLPALSCRVLILDFSKINFKLEQY